jgi:hypothetical protein
MIMTATEPKTLATASEGDIFEHEVTKALIVVVDRPYARELLTVQLNDGVEGHDRGWVGMLEIDASGWIYQRTAT